MDRRPSHRVPTLLAVAALAPALIAGCGAGGSGGTESRAAAGVTASASASTSAVSDAGPSAGPSGGTGAGTGADPSVASTVDPSAPADAKAATIESLAKSFGCTPDITIDVADYRQAVCKTGAAKYLLLDFVTDKGKRDWLDAAQMYGGVYLVGDRWVVSADPRSAMEKARGEFGGRIEESGGLGS